MEYLLAASTDKLNQQLEQVQALNHDIEGLKAVRVLYHRQSEPNCRPDGSTQATIDTQGQAAAPSPESLCASCRCSLTDAPITNSRINRAVNTARVHGSVGEPVDDRYTDIESLWDADGDCQVVVSGCKRDGQKQVNRPYTFKAWAAKAKNACKKLLIKRSTSRGASSAISDSSSSKVGSSRQVNPDDMLSATTVWRWTTDRNSRYNGTPMYVNPGDLQMMLDFRPIGGHAPNSGVPLMVK